jgi:hypothetical protein
VFLNACTTVGRLVARVPCGDPDGADRQGIHADTIKIAVDFFAANLR